ncbi:NADPH--hemoprotein reductase [Malassezia brasiliensis]|uniref:NADPH--cytochrome P450 reductase n=1 Tax=Malassezia brasiliensis TaxID=1821822 RepID=A0AAF0DT11_9BASI|nr:NADPH--hemoprotein reductase [Malassezia brasiliensis]
MPGTLAIAAAVLVGLLTLYYLSGVLFGGGESKPVEEESHGGSNFVERMADQKKRLVVFFGSQTGTAEEYAIRLAREAKERYGVGVLVLDIQDEEMDKLDQLPEDSVAIFVMATYGEGEPTDNAVEFMEFLRSPDVAFSENSTLNNVHYVALGLGNKTYEMYNETIKQLDERMRELGAQRIGEVGLCDDDASIEEDYLAWKDPMFEQLASYLNLEEGNTGDMSDFTVTEVTDVADASRIYQGEHHPRALSGVKGNHDARNPYPASVVRTHELFTEGVASRSCVHMEFDIQGSGITYQHGDHLAVWPVNPEPQVERMLAVLGLQDKRNTVVQIKSLDPALAKVPFPQPTTYEAIFRYYLDINAHASRQALASFVPFAPNVAAREKLERLSKDRDFFLSHVGDYGYKLGEVLQMVAGDSTRDEDISSSTVWPIPFDRVISSVSRLTPRFYSISSSPKLSPDRIHVTVVVLRYTPAQGSKDVYGLASNFISSVKMAQNSERPDLEDPRHGTPQYYLRGPRDAYVDEAAGQYRVPIHVRRSTFRLPTSTKIPIIMVGPGTGVSPFRSFVQERVANALKAKEKLGADALQDWADMTLYYGCRRSNEDFLYKDEWPEYAEKLDNKFNLRVSLSREVFNPDGSKKYVQDLIWEDREKLAHQILQQRAHVYICGEGKGMAQDVEQTLAKILGEAKGGGVDVGLAEIKVLKDRHRLALDVWS